MKHAQQYFKKYRTATILYFTCDDLAFTNEQEATRRARMLDDDTVIPITRQEADAAMADIVDDGWDELPEPDELYIDQAML